MLDTKEIQQLGKIKNRQNTNINIDLFLSFFTTTYKEKIKLILNKNRYIPQEIINAEILRKLLR